MSIATLPVHVTVGVGHAIADETVGGMTGTITDGITVGVTGIAGTTGVVGTDGVTGVTGMTGITGIVIDELDELVVEELVAFMHK